MPKVYSLRKSAIPPPTGAIYVGRGTPWFNPFLPESGRFPESQRDAICNRFEVYALDRLRREPDWLEPLRGNNLVCWCAPKRCHADTLLWLANRRDAEAALAEMAREAQEVGDYFG